MALVGAAAYDTALRSGPRPLVATRGGACWGCGLALPAGLKGAFSVHQRVAACPHCSRLLYDPSWLEGA
jgi:predicted  nucleic acid-binding Zn-ribbon protein